MRAYGAQPRKPVHVRIRPGHKAQHRRHSRRRPRQRGPRLSRQRHQDSEYRQARQRWRATGIVLRDAGLHPVACRADDRPLCHALRPGDAGDLSEPHLWTAHRRAYAPAGFEGCRLRHGDGRQVASRPCRPEILAAESRLRPFLRQPRRRGGLFHQGAGRAGRLAA